MFHWRNILPDYKFVSHFTYDKIHSFCNYSMTSILPVRSPCLSFYVLSFIQDRVTQQVANSSTEILIAFFCWCSLEKAGIVKSRLANWLVPRAVMISTKIVNLLDCFAEKLVLKEAGVKSLVSYITVALCIPETPSFSKQSAWVHPLWPADM